MSRRKFEMHHYRQSLMRMRQGDSDRDIGRSRLMSRKKAAALRLLAIEQNWLTTDLLPDGATIARSLRPASIPTSARSLHCSSL